VTGDAEAFLGDRSRKTDEGAVMSDETYKGEFYCVKCKAKREAEGKVVTTENGRRMAKGKCPVCGTNLNRILAKA
jgi:Zn finger protein HypA/HybF involved in hydrogenase expression